MAATYDPPEAKPDLLILISGKRKCGKDYFMDLLQKRLDELNIQAGIMRISAPIKHFWSEKHSLDYSKLLDSSSYKEDHRLGMVQWSMKHRAENPGYFPKEAIRMADAAGKPIWICVDIRHLGDYDWFREHYADRLKRIRVSADEDVRKSRGWSFQEGVDDTASECNWITLRTGTLLFITMTALEKKFLKG